MTSITFFLFFIPVLVIILLIINLIFAPHNAYQEKNTAFECGFHSFLGQNRTQFSISFFIFALLFLLFDLEILLVYPYVVSSYNNGIYGLMLMLIFFLALTLGFAFELGKNALKIDSRQMLVIKNRNLNITSFTTNKSSFNIITEYPLEILDLLVKIFIYLILILLVLLVSAKPSVKENDHSQESLKRRLDRRYKIIQDDKDWNDNRREIILKVSAQWAHNIEHNASKSIYGPYPVPMELTTPQLEWLHQFLPLYYPQKYYYNGNRLCIPNFQVNTGNTIISNPNPVKPCLSLIHDIGHDFNTW